MIVLQNVSHQYTDGDKEALSGVSLTIAQGRHVAVIGPNGSGKSTLIRHLNGLFLPTAGRVLVDGLDTASEADLRAIRQKVAFVFQNPDNQVVGVSVEDDIAFGPENLGLPPDEISRRVEAALLACGLTSLRSKPPHLLSGGEKQRLAIAGAYAMDFSYLVLDEPTSMLDPLLRDQVLDLVLQMKEERGCAIVYVTNILQEALLADEVIVLNQGKLFARGTPSQVFADRAALEAIGLGVPPVSRAAALLAAQGIDVGQPQSFEALLAALGEVRLCK